MNKYNANILCSYITLIFKILFIYIAKNYLYFSKLQYTCIHDTTNFFFDELQTINNTTELCLSKNPLDSIFRKISFHIFTS